VQRPSHVKSQIGHGFPISRIDRWQAATIGEIADILSRLPAPCGLLMDVHPSLATRRSEKLHLAAQIDNLVRAFTVVPHVVCVVLTTNGYLADHYGRSSPIMVRVAERAMKPWLPDRSRRNLTADIASFAVCGDQLLTDGLLAWRLGAPFIHWTGLNPEPSRRTELLETLGQLLPMRIFFRERR
jgi:hypothetical protein